MASYFRKSIKIAPGIHLNLSKRGTGISLGGRGAHISLSPTGRVAKTLNVPGTGVLFPQPEEPAVHQVVAVDHYGFYISHGIAAFVSILAAVLVSLRYGSHPLNIWVPILGTIGAISLILWLMDLTQTKVERRSHE